MHHNHSYILTYCFIHNLFYSDDIAVALKDSDVDSEAVSSGTEDAVQKEVISTASPDVTRINSDFKSQIKKPTDASWSSEDYRQAMETSETNEIIFKSPVKPTASTTTKVFIRLFSYLELLR